MNDLSFEEICAKSMCDHCKIVHPTRLSDSGLLCDDCFDKNYAGVPAYDKKKKNMQHRQSNLMQQGTVTIIDGEIVAFEPNVRNPYVSQMQKLPLSDEAV